MNISEISLEQVNSMNKNTLMEVLGIECIEIGEDFVRSTMPVDKRTHQPMGLLHGGATAALIESIGSMGSSLHCDLSKVAPVGLEINANHVRGVREGFVEAIGKIVHKGRTTHLWQVDVFDGNTKKLVCTGRLTVILVPHSK